MTWDPFRQVGTMRGNSGRLFDSKLGRYFRERAQTAWAPGPPCAGRLSFFVA